MAVDAYHLGWDRIDIDSTEEDWIDKVAEELGEGHDYGIYQLYGDHPVYGDDVLLYIGKAQEQRFAQRIPQHSDEWYDLKRCSRLHVGRVYKMKQGQEENWGEVIANVEELLIYAHAPALNKRSVNERLEKNKDEHFIVRNWGEYGSIQQELSTLMHSYRYYDEDKFSFEYLSEDE